MHVGGSRVVFSESSRVIDLGSIGVEFQSGQVKQSNTEVKQSKEQVKIHLGVMCMSGIFSIFFWVSPDMVRLVKTRSGCS
jgi:hypothetical protein